MEHKNTSGLHKKSAPHTLRFALVTVSTSRYRKFGSVSDPDEADDISGRLMIDMLRSSGFEVSGYSLLPDDEERIRQHVMEMSRSGAQAIILSGGTGLSPDDVTLEAVSPLFSKQIPGFGELFRHKSYECVGTSAILSRAEAGIVGGCLVCCLPGSPGAVELALKELIIPEAAHIVKHAFIQNI